MKKRKPAYYFVLTVASFLHYYIYMHTVLLNAFYMWPKPHLVVQYQSMLQILFINCYAFVRAHHVPSVTRRVSDNVLFLYRNDSWITSYEIKAWNTQVNEIIMGERKWY